MSRSADGPLDMSSVLAELRDFMAARDWQQFHSPSNLAKSVAVEAGELLECFQWSDDVDRGRVLGELADVLTYSLLLADALEADPMQVVLEKLAITESKYPVEKAFGRSTKHDRL